MFIVIRIGYNAKILIDKIVLLRYNDSDLVPCKGESVTTTLVMNRRQRLLYFPSLHAGENKFSTVFKFVFEIITKLTINWWALALTWVGDKTRQRWLVVIIKQIPNGLSFFRILVTPIICFHLVVGVKDNDHTSLLTWFVIMLVVICLDALDGPAARDLDAVTEFGAVLDPASDKFCFFLIILAYCIATFFQYSIPFCLAALAFALACLFVEYRLIVLSLGKFNQLIKILKVYNPNFTQPGAFLAGKIKFNLQMAACAVGWLGLIWFVADPTTIFVMAILLFAARNYGYKSLALHQNEYIWLLVVAIVLQNIPDLRTITIEKHDDPPDNIYPIRKSA